MSSDDNIKVQSVNLVLVDLFRLIIVIVDPRLSVSEVSRQKIKLVTRRMHEYDHDSTANSEQTIISKYDQVTHPSETHIHRVSETNTPVPFGSFDERFCCPGKVVTRAHAYQQLFLVSGKYRSQAVMTAAH